MEHSGFTPGKLYIDSVERDVGWASISTDKSGDGLAWGHLAQVVVTRNGKPFAEGKANLALFLDAPNLVAERDRLRGVVRNLVEALDTAWPHENLNTALAAARKEMGQ